MTEPNVLPEDIALAEEICKTYRLFGGGQRDRIAALIAAHRPAPALDLAEIERALEPFAEWACEYDRLQEDAVLDVRVKAGALLRAAAALASVREVTK